MDCNCEGYIGRVYRVISEAYPSTARSRITSSFECLVQFSSEGFSSILLIVFSVSRRNLYKMHQNNISNWNIQTFMKKNYIVS